jgi:MutS-like protein
VPVPVSDVERTYLTRLEARRAVLADRERVHRRLGQSSLGLVLLAVALLLAGGAATAPALLVVALTFAGVVIVHTRVIGARDRARSAVAFYERGLARLRHEWIGRGETGERFHPANHLYADDLDLFGRGSLFELLATARTHAGEEAIAAWLKAPAPPGEIRLRQDAVRELIPALDLRERMAIAGDGLPQAGVHAEALRAWAAKPAILRHPWPRVLMAALSAFVLPAIVWILITDRPSPWVPRVVLAGLAVQLGVALWFRTRVVETIQTVAPRARDLDLFASLLRVLEEPTFTSARLKALSQALDREHRPASAEIARLDRLVSLLSLRSNIFTGLPAALAFSGTQLALAIDAWRMRHAADIPRWLEVVGEFDALLALATFAAERPDHTFPELASGAATVHAEQLAHPLLPATAVANDVALGGAAPQLLVVSGSNMSGKSTLLRALGLNVVLAQTGAPVRAARFVLSPLAVGGSIRVLDSLLDGKSRFYAEITRLKQIVDLVAGSDGHVLFLLDEILSGTNSHDRRHGAEALLTGLVRRGAIGLVTTHDLALGAIATALAPRAGNVHLEDRFEAGVMTFDYHLRPGIVRTSNAVELMRSVGLDV